ncbi:MAG: hypothetical protein WBC51_23350 [Vicinamibacterales bacterium]
MHDRLTKIDRVSTSSRRARALAAVLATLAAVAIALTIRAIAPFGAGLLLCGMVALFAVPGLVVAWIVFAPRPGRLLAVCGVGPIWGYGLSSAALLALWAVGVRSWPLLLAPALASLLAAPLAGLARGSITAAPARRADLLAILILIALVPAIVGRPFARVGEEVPDGRAYRAYFTADMVWRMAVVAELSKGEFPPRNPFYRGDRMHYYWLAHLLPAAEYRLLHKQVSIEQILLTHSVALDLAFVMFLFAFARQWIESTGAVLVACIAALLGSSFEGTERVFYYWRQGAPLTLVETLNIDAVTRWFYGSLPVDGLQRLLWYQPHHSTGYSLGLSALWLAGRADDPLSPRVMALCGALLGLCLLLSTFSAIMLTVMVASVTLIRVIAGREWRRTLPAAIAGAVPLGAATALAFSLHYVDRSGSSLFRILANPLAFQHTTAVLILSFGPLLLGGIAGTVSAVRARRDSFIPIVVIVLVSFLFYFFVDLRDHQFVYVGWRAGHLLFIALTVLTGLAIQELMRRPPPIRASFVVAAAILLLLSAPTFAIDFYNTQDISNRRPGPGFPWTLVLSHDELDMLKWIKSYTRPNAIVQVEPFSRDPSTWAYVPAFAERRMAAGLPISMVPLHKYEAASVQVRALYQETDPRGAYQRAAQLGIDYLIVGGPERRAYPAFEGMLAASPVHFRPVFKRPDLSLYAVEGGH